MQLITIVEGYIYAALQHAEVERMEDGTLVATVPELPGIIAFGADQHECSKELYRLIEESLRIWLRKGYDAPVIDGIDLSSEKTHISSSKSGPSRRR